MNESIHIVCPHCAAVNRVPLARDAREALCGRCKAGLFSGRPLRLRQAQFRPFIGGNDIPVLVDFWAAWCGPCRMMEPVIEQAAQRLEPRLWVAKVNTEEDRELSTQYGIRGIPTLILFHKGRELSRQSGAMDLGTLEAWVGNHLGGGREPRP